MLNIYFILSLIFIHLNRRNIRDGQQLDGEWIFFFLIQIIIIGPIYSVLSMCRHCCKLFICVN